MIPSSMLSTWNRASGASTGVLGSDSGSGPWVGSAVRDGVWSSGVPGVG